MTNGLELFSLLLSAIIEKKLEDILYCYIVAVVQKLPKCNKLFIALR